jgi:internalin A
MRGGVRYSLRLLLLAMAVIAVLLAWIGPRWRLRQAEMQVAQKLTASGGHVAFLFPGEPEGNRIVALYLDHSGVKDDDLKLVNRLPRLRLVHLAGTGVSGVGIERVCRLPDLEWLDVSRNDLSQANLESFAKCQRLRQLELASTGVTDEHLARIEPLVGLESLDLSNNATVTADGMAHIAKLSNLRLLQLNFTGVTESGLTHLKALTRLEDLELSGMQISEAGVAPLREMKSLKRLFIKHSRIGAAEVRALKEALPGTMVVD